MTALSQATREHSATPDARPSALRRVVRTYVDAVRAAPEVATVLTVALGLFALGRAYAVAEGWGFDPEAFAQRNEGIWYFADYSHGFTRRAFVGAVLGAIDPPSYALTANLTAIAITALAVVVLAGAAVRFAALASTPTRRLALFAVVVTSPLFLSSLLRDLGRLDGVGIICGGVAVVALRSERLTLPVAGATAAAAVAVATATEEFLFLYLAPLTVLALWGRLGARRILVPPLSFVARGAAVLLPAAAVLLASMVVPVSTEYVDHVASRTGIAAGELTSPGDSLWAVQQTFAGSHEFVRAVGWSQLVVTLISAGVFLLTVLAIGRLLRTSRAYWLLVLLFASVATVLALVAVDARRFWGLSLVALVAGCIALHRRGVIESHEPPADERAEPVRGRVLTAALVTGCLLVSVGGQSLPLWGAELGYWVSLLHEAFYNLNQ